jgi:hypothetical protein
MTLQLIHVVALIDIEDRSSPLWRTRRVQELMSLKDIVLCET